MSKVVFDHNAFWTDRERKNKENVGCIDWSFRHPSMGKINDFTRMNAGLLFLSPDVVSSG
jgi:hypothetical protein